MTDFVQLDEQKMALLEQAQIIMADFRRAFSKSLSADFIAEILAAKHLGLSVCIGTNQPGFDAVDPAGLRYQVKNRAIGTPIVDLNNFDFDYLVLVNLDDDYRLAGMWRITAAQAQAITTFRPDYRKYQTTQNKVKGIGEHLA